MIIALPLTENDEFSLHFGGSAKVGLFEIDRARSLIVRATAVVPTEPEPCGWAGWLVAQGVTLLLVGGIGRGARQRMAATGIEVLVGMPAADPAALVQAWLDGRLVPSANTCDAGNGDHGDQHHAHHAGDCGCSH